MDGKEKSVSEIQQQLMLWVEQTKRLLVSLPSCLSELEQLKGEAGKFYDRINELERENRELRQSHEDLNHLRQAEGADCRAPRSSLPEGCRRTRTFGVCLQSPSLLRVRVRQPGDEPRSELVIGRHHHDDFRD